VKILDFGLAKFVPRREFLGEPSSHDLTRSGVVVGTMNYMSPEQFAGAKVDHRSDIYAFGIILHEMFVGRRPFERGTPAATTQATLNAEVPELPAALQAELPDLQEVIVHCLEKKPEDRFQSARDIAFQLTLMSRRVPSRGAARLLNGHAIRRRSFVVAAATMLAVGLVATAGLIVQRAITAPVASYRQLTFQRGSILSARSAADGRTIAYGAEWNGAPAQIFSTRVEGPESRPLLNLINADVLAISQQGGVAILLDRQRQGAWPRRGTLASVPLGGDAPRPIMTDVQDADWSPDGTNLAVVHIVSGRYRLEYPLGAVRYETDGWISQPRVGLRERGRPRQPHEQRLVPVCPDAT
jgi:eukaryotic-like serine/threonine-protein kinase